MKKAKMFLVNSVVMTATALVIRIIGVIFNVYVSRKMGLSGMGLIEIIMSVFSFSVIVACSGIGLATTRLVSEELAVNSHAGIRKSMKTCILYAIGFGTFAGIVLFFGADFIGTKLLGDARTVKSLVILSVSLPFYSAQCAFYGYFTAVRKVYLSSITQILEVAFRIGITVLFLEKFLPLGIEYACIGFMLAATASEVFAFTIMLLAFLLDKRRYKKKDTTSNNITKRLFRISMPVAVSMYACSALVTIKNIMIPLGLVKWGMTRDMALAEFGVISGMVIPIILFPSAFLTAFTSLIVPELTESNKLNNQKRISYIITRTFQVTLIFTICVIAIFLMFPNEFGMVIYKNIRIGTYIKILTPLVLIAYLDGITDAMLKGLDKQVDSMFFNIFDSAVSIILVYVLLPKFGLNGFLFVMFASKLLNTYLSINKITKVCEFKINYADWFIKPFICSYIAVSFSKFIVNCLNHEYRYSAPMLIKYVTLSIALYVLFILVFKCVKKDELKKLFSRFK